MKFGNVDDSALLSIDLSLPSDPAWNSRLLSGSRVNDPKVYIGSSNWGHTSWLGRIYPARTPATKYRENYPKHFNAVELNATHYQIYPPATIRAWAEAARGRDFRYCPKFPQLISHYSSFTGIAGETERFLESVSAFGENLGPCFLQLSNGFTPVAADAVLSYLGQLPRELAVFLEVRHSGWFQRAGELFPQLSAMGRGLVITDAPGRRDCTHMWLTVDKLFLRFVSNRDHPTTYRRIEDWGQRLGNWISRGLSEAYIFLHPGDESVIPELTAAWMETLNRHGGLTLKPPTAAQGSLF